ncbi:hypothetical protein E3O21_07895 [Cryobacterium flavum]|uniref:DUF2993 domain-containing protein n=2 Tax=Cryobacterium flavum TaxID=1424659 RepID=A0ABY2I277_9MICO|nr:hypothetical protein [Cryobacterium flavum]TFB77595.1 hypothetical protein E3O21_07895 [Cryobacterium flavum]
MTIPAEQHRASGRRGSMLRAVLAIVVVAGLLAAGVAGTISALNRTVYSAGGFVEQYLDALARGDTVGALALGGVMPGTADLAAWGLTNEVAKDLPETLLRASVLGGLDNIELASTTDTLATDDGTAQTVVFDFDLNGTASSMVFTVERAGTFGGVFNAWAFSTSPLAVLQVSVLHERSFTVNGLTLDTRAHSAADAPATFSTSAAYLAFAPNRYTFEHESAMLTAEKATVRATVAGPTAVEVNALPNEAMVGQVQSELNKFLDDCATQTVLQPTSCPWGITIDDRIESTPAWSITAYPTVALTPGELSFEMGATPGQAHIVVDVQSLFDGDVSTRDEDVPFTMGLSVVVQPSGALAIQLH